MIAFLHRLLSRHISIPPRGEQPNRPSSRRLCGEQLEDRMLLSVANSVPASTHQFGGIMPVDSVMVNFQTAHESPSVRHDRTETVNQNETITIHGNRTETVNKDETITIHVNRTPPATQNDTTTVGPLQIHLVWDDVGVPYVLSQLAPSSRPGAAASPLTVCATGRHIGVVTIEFCVQYRESDFDFGSRLTLQPRESVGFEKPFLGRFDMAAGDVNGDGFADIITGRGPGKPLTPVPDDASGISLPGLNSQPADGGKKGGGGPNTATDQFFFNLGSGRPSR